MIKLHPDDSGAVPLYEGYMLVRSQIRDREENAHAGRGVGLEGPEREKWNERGREMQIRHLKEEYEEAEMFAYLNGRDVDRAQCKLVAGALDTLLHCLVGKRWCEGEGEDGNPQLLRRIKAAEMKTRESIKKYAHVKLENLHPFYKK